MRSKNMVREMWCLWSKRFFICPMIDSSRARNCLSSFPISQTSFKKKQVIILMSSYNSWRLNSSAFWRLFSLASSIASKLRPFFILNVHSNTGVLVKFIVRTFATIVEYHESMNNIFPSRMHGSENRFGQIVGVEVSAAFRFEITKILE